MEYSIANGDKYCLIAWNNTIKSLNYKADICFFGNSLTCYSNFKNDFPNKNVIILGYPGQGVKGMIKRYRQISLVNPDKIFIMAGINDLNFNRVSNDDFCVLYENLVDSILLDNPKSVIYLQSILPVNHKINPSHPPTENIIRINDFIKHIAFKKNILFLDLFSLYCNEHGELRDIYTIDGIHLKDTAYYIWSKKIQEVIK